MAKKYAFGWIPVLLGALSPELYGVEETGIRAAFDRYKVIGVISEESPKKPLAGVAVLKDARTSLTHTLTIGDPLPGDPNLSLVSTKAGHVTVSDGREETTLGHTETVVEDAILVHQEDLGLADGKWDEKVSLLGNAGLLTKERRLLPDSKGDAGQLPLTTAEEKVRFPYYRADAPFRDAEWGMDNFSDPLAEMDSFSQDWEWMPASDLSLADLDVPNPEISRGSYENGYSPWWVGKDEARSEQEIEP